MIKCEDYVVTMRGNNDTLACDFVLIVHSFRKELYEDLPKETAEQLIADLGKLAFIDEDCDDFEKKFNEILEASPLLERRK